MSVGLKVFLWIVGIIAIVIALLVGAGFYMGAKAREGIKEGREFAEHAQKSECVPELARRNAECDGAACVAGSAVFGLTCLRRADGFSEDVCDIEESFKELAKRQCTPYGKTKYCEEVTASIVQAYCNDPDFEVEDF